MNRRQAKKKLKKDYGVLTPRQESPRVARKFTLSLIDLVQEKLVKYIDELILKGKKGEL